MDAYEILGIDRDADTREIHVAFRRRAKHVHPDAGGDADGFVRLNEAYQLARTRRRATRPRRPGAERLIDRARPRRSGRDRIGDRPETVAPDAARYELAEIAYRFELARPDRTPSSFFAAVDAELYPGAAPADIGDDAVAFVSYLLSRRVKTALIVAAIVSEIDRARR